MMWKEVTVAYCDHLEVLKAVIMKSTVFWDVTLCSWAEIEQRFGGTTCLHLQGGKVNQARNQ
jgi:hypothetical protein